MMAVKILSGQTKISERLKNLMDNRQSSTWPKTKDIVYFTSGGNGQGSPLSQLTGNASDMNKVKMIKILIADDHAVVREGLKKILADVLDMEIAGEAADGVEALQLMRCQNWDVVLLDISMPGKNGLDVLKIIRAEKPKLPILVLSIYSENQYALRVLKAGASGYLTKESAPDQLVTAIRKVAQGGKYISTVLAEKLAATLADPTERLLHEALSDREMEILRLMASGYTPSQIALELFISTKTVSTYRARLLHKMSMQSNAELINYAIKNNLVY